MTLTCILASNRRCAANSLAKLFPSARYGCAVVGILAAACFASRAEAGFLITASPGYTITHDGSDGDFFGQPVPDNLALASNGGSPFSDGDLQPGGPFHFTSRLNDGIYGNSNSWISDDDTPDVSFAGVALAPLASNQRYRITGIAWGRDNGGEVTQFTDRDRSLYTMQRTLVASPGAGTPVTGNPATGWETIGSVDYLSTDDNSTGGLFTEYFRNQWNILLGGEPFDATGIRLVMSAENVALDEIEIIGTLQVVPEPSALSLSVLAGLGIGGWRRRAAAHRRRR